MRCIGFAEEIAGSCIKTAQTHRCSAAMLYAASHNLAAGQMILRPKLMFRQEFR
jgi:hypothetical protein